MSRRTRKPAAVVVDEPSRYEEEAGRARMIATQSAREAAYAHYAAGQPMLVIGPDWQSVWWLCSDDRLVPVDDDVHAWFWAYASAFPPYPDWVAERAPA